MFWKKKGQNQNAQPSPLGMRSGGFSLGGEAPATGVEAKHSGAERTGSVPAMAPANSDTRASYSGGPQFPVGSVTPSRENGALRRGTYIVPKGYKITGTIFVENELKVEGELAGRGAVAPLVSVGGTGTLRSPVDCASIIVDGLVSSPVSAGTLVDVRPGGRISSDVDSPSLKVSAGATVSGGRCSIHGSRKATS